MRALRMVVLLFALLVTAVAAAQQRPIFDPDDAVDPSHKDGLLIISRVIAGGAANYVDDYRPLDQSARFLAIANAFYWRRLQFDYKYIVARGENDAPVVSLCGQCEGGQYFPTPPSANATPAPPLPGPKNVLQFAWYSAGESPLRHRATWTHQRIETVVHSGASGQVLWRLSGDEQSFGFETDTRVRIGGRRLFGVASFARTIRTGTVDDRAQSELTYMQRFSAISVRNLLLRGTLTVGHVSNRGGTALNVVNPAIEAYWQDRATRANLHLVWSPQLLNSGRDGWKTNHQIAFFVDRHLFLKLASASHLRRPSVNKP
jgi:hypothetical protein